MDGTHSIIQGFMARCSIHYHALYCSVRTGLLHLLIDTGQGSPGLGWWLMDIPFGNLFKDVRITPRPRPVMLHVGIDWSKGYLKSQAIERIKRQPFF